MADLQVSGVPIEGEAGGAADAPAQQGHQHGGGDVHLGWHYALDGYAGAAGAALVWHAVGRMLRTGGVSVSTLGAAAPCMSKGGLLS